MTAPMRVFHVGPEQFAELDALPAQLPSSGFVWIGIARRELDAALPRIQDSLRDWGCGALVDLHVSDLLNNHLPSHFDTTSYYDLLVFRRLAALPGSASVWANGRNGTQDAVHEAMAAIDTSPVGFAAFDRVLLSVHAPECAVREYFAQRLALQAQSLDTRGQARLPPIPADLMLRMANHMVDSYLELRRLLSRQLDTLESELLDPKSRFYDWKMLLDARKTLHMLEDICEDQRSAMQEWIDALEEWPLDSESGSPRERELLRLRSRDVVEHIERVLTHVRRLELSAEAAVQMHFSALGHRTNDIMRTLTVLTAIFLPLNLITGFFGMNFDTLPLIHSATGAWVASIGMAVVAIVLGVYFWRKRYLGSRRRP